MRSHESKINEDLPFVTAHSKRNICHSFSFTRNILDAYLGVSC